MRQKTGRCETNKFRTAKREGRCRKHRGKAFEAFPESPRVSPILAADEASYVGRNTAAIDVYAENDEDNDGNYFD